MASDWKTRLEGEVDRLRAARDELRVQLHLGAAEAREVWESAERSWEHLEARLKRVGHATQESVDDVEDAAKLLVDEIKAGYERVRSLL